MKQVTSIRRRRGSIVPLSTVKAMRQRYFGHLRSEAAEATPTKAAKDKAASIAGRDGYIVKRALLYAIAHIRSLPPEEQEGSDMADMCAIARAHDASTMGAYAADVCTHTGVAVELWPGEALRDSWDLAWAGAFNDALFGPLEEPTKPKKTNQDTLAGA
jgi:hypothetical protein